MLEDEEVENKQAVRWYRKWYMMINEQLKIRAADQGLANAQNNLGWSYLQGEGVEQDCNQALKWIRKAADQGLALGQNNLGLMYDEGKGVAQDYNQALKWIHKAADQGLALGQNNLGLMYGEGKGVAQDYNQALRWYRKAADQGDALGQYNLGYMYDEGKGVAQDDNQALRWYRKAADQGLALGQNNLGLMYGEGKGVAQDYNQALRWYRKAADQGDALGQYNLGYMYDEGKGVAQDNNQALRWYRKAADQGHTSAQYNLGVMYREGKGVAQDDKQAARWYRKAADQGDADAQHNLDVMCDEGVAHNTEILKQSMSEADYQKMKLNIFDSLQEIKRLTAMNALADKQVKEVKVDHLSHELKGPIAATRANLEILKQNMSEADFQKMKLNIDDSVNRLMTVTEEFSILTKLNHTDSLETENIDINEAIKNILKDLNISQKIQNKNIKILTKNIDTLLTVNKVFFEICLFNILNNAIDFSSNNKNIFIESVETKEHVSIKILDEGTGIPINMINKIQNDHVSMSRPDTDKRSTGLGLTIVNKIMDKHNGSFEISNRQDTNGVVVTLTFPK